MSESVKEERMGIVNTLLFAFIVVFFIPIMWLGEKIGRGSSGAAAAFGSFAAATLVMLVAFFLTVGTVAGLLIYHYH